MCAVHTHWQLLHGRQVNTIELLTIHFVHVCSLEYNYVKVNVHTSICTVEHLDAWLIIIMYVYYARTRQASSFRKLVLGGRTWNSKILGGNRIYVCECMSWQIFQGLSRDCGKGNKFSPPPKWNHACTCTCIYIHTYTIKEVNCAESKVVQLVRLQPATHN